MKKSYLLILCLVVFPLQGIVQNYQAVYPDREVCFLGFNQRIECIRIDSVHNGQDIVLYPNPINQIIGLDPDSDMGCYSPTLGSWIGSSIVIKDNGYVVFLNHTNDSVKINTAASQGDTWLVYDIPGEIQIFAEVVGHELMDFLGVTDSVKIISFQAYTFEGEPVDVDVNDKQVMISKNYGFVQTLSFYYFPDFFVTWWPGFHSKELSLAGLSEPELGVQNLTWFDVHDFQPGDEIHVLSKDGHWIGWQDGYFNVKETRMIYHYLERTDYNDSIEYTYSLAKRVHFQWLDSIVLFQDTLTRMIKPNPDFDKMPGEPVFIYFQDEEPWAYMYYVMHKSEHIMKTTFNYWYDYVGGDCWAEGHFDGVPESIRYFKGLGGPYYPYSAMFGYLLEKMPVYYKKGDETWGTPLDVSSVNEIIPPSLVTVYPNPAKDVLTVRLEEPGQHGTLLRIFDISGRLVHSSELQSGENTLGVSHLKRGVYFCMITHGRGGVEVKKIVVQ